jgi:hypothetical protein
VSRPSSYYCDVIIISILLSWPGVGPATHDLQSVQSGSPVRSDQCWLGNKREYLAV